MNINIILQTILLTPSTSHTLTPSTSHTLTLSTSHTLTPSISQLKTAQAWYGNAGNDMG